ncbi:hypothetical protein GCM10025870_28100 [Agromyces marinus]|uniref:Uncharacterized protein n=1 Tax=Agromyces marinus TaxID=1389020 RepID=A0ABM8H4K6_9MICO|nr:hypothetical protein GCM10025870_28100 [Agromyces marinus]
MNGRRDGSAGAPPAGAGDGRADRPAEVQRADASEETPAPRQRVERARGARRARLTPAPGTDPEPETAVPGAHDDRERGASKAPPEDDRITRERPPHW